MKPKNRFEDIHIPRTQEDIEFYIRNQSVFLCYLHYDTYNPFVSIPAIIYLVVDCRDIVSFMTSRHSEKSTLAYGLPLFANKLEHIAMTHTFISSFIDKGKTVYDPFGLESISQRFSPLSENIFNLLDCEQQNPNLIKLFSLPKVEELKWIFSFDPKEYESRDVFDKIAYIAFCLRKHQERFGNHWEDDPPHIPEHDD